MTGLRVPYAFAASRRPRRRFLGQWQRFLARVRSRDVRSPSPLVLRARVSSFPRIRNIKLRDRAFVIRIRDSYLTNGFLISRHFDNADERRPTPYRICVVVSLVNDERLFVRREKEREKWCSDKKKPVKWSMNVSDWYSLTSRNPNAWVISMVQDSIEAFFPRENRESFVLRVPHRKRLVRALRIHVLRNAEVALAKRPGHSKCEKIPLMFNWRLNEKTRVIGEKDRFIRFFSSRKKEDWIFWARFLRNCDLRCETTVYQFWQWDEIASAIEDDCVRWWFKKVRGAFVEQVVIIKCVYNRAWLRSRRDRDREKSLHNGSHELRAVGLLAKHIPEKGLYAN